MSRAFQKGSQIDFRAAVKLPVAASREQVVEWIEYCTGARPDIQSSNPLIAFDMDAFGGVITFPK
jgi:hypothetical protein